MTHGAEHKGPRIRGMALPALAVLSALGLFAALQALALSATGGVFEYPLDDPYIHLALAEQIAHGNYGVNVGEVSSPGSSALFPLLLTPFSGMAFQRYLPLFWNIIGLTLSAFFWGRLLFEAGYTRAGWRWLGAVAALLGPLAVLMPHLAFVGMEHSLHMAASLAILLGLHRHLDGRGGLWLMALGAFFATALRFEGLALGIAAAGVLAFTGARRAGLATAVLTVLPIAAFMAFLARLGLDPLPSSVVSKLTENAGTTAGGLSLWFAELAQTLHRPGGMLIALYSFGLLGLWRIMPALRESRWAWLAIAVVLAGFAHLAVGRVGWLNRYESYLLATLAATILVLLPKAIASRPRIGGWATGSAVLAAGVLIYQPGASRLLFTAPLAIHSQQAQMARFVKLYLKAPVAVNDIGLVSWQNPDYVLDLWGLADAQAREIRLSDPPPGWAGPLAEAHQVPAALVYDNWLEEGIGPDWVKLGELRLTRMVGFLGGPNVSFYATAPEHVDMLRDAIAAWQPTISGVSAWHWAEGMAP